MGTDIRPEVSKHKEYWVPKHRYYELKHFCLQYSDWLECYHDLEHSRSKVNLYSRYKGKAYSDPTCKTVILMDRYKRNIDLVESVCKEVADDIYEFLLKAVTEGLSYEYLYHQLNMPASRKYFYERYRKFFWVLDTKKFYRR